MQPQTPAAPAQTRTTTVAARPAPQVTAASVSTVQARVSRVVGSGVLDSAPFSYHH